MSSLLRTPVRRRSIGLAAATLLALSACGTSSKDAEFADAEGSDQGGADASDGGSGAGSDDAAASLPRVESGFLTEEFADDIPSTETIRPEKAQVITPSGTLTVDEVRAVESVAADQIDLAATSDGGGEAGSASGSEEGDGYGPAQGEVFRLVDLSWAPQETSEEEDPWGTAAQDGPATALAVMVHGSQTTLRDLADQEDVSFLMSVPEDGSAQLVISCEGHDQVIDLLTGERQDDEVAAAYYRENAVQEPHHTLPIESTSFPTESHTGPEEDIATDFSYQVASAQLTAWTEDDGWAEPGSAWLVIDWSYDLDIDGEDFLITTFTTLTSTLSVDVDGEVTTDDAFVEDKTAGVTGEVTTTVKVPLETTTATLSISGSVDLEIPQGMGVTLADETSADFASDELEISFPAAD